MKKIILIVTTLFLSVGLLGIVLFLFLLSPLNKEAKSYNFEVKKGSSTRLVISELKSHNLIRNELATLVYFKLHPKYNIKAGTFKLSAAYSTEKIIKLLDEGNTLEKEGITVTFIEGKRLTYYVDVISNKFGYSKEDIMAVLSDKTYLNELINKYWFITDEILNDELYYPLEGYLYPDTYKFAKDSSIKTIINKLVYTLSIKLAPYKEEIESNDLTFHEILSLASDVEVEGGKESDRKLIAGIFLKRLALGMNLGSDVTTYYAVKKDLNSGDLWINDINYDSPYNTRLLTKMAGKINVGPICNPSIISIKAVLEPTTSDYLYFYADWLGDGKVYYSKTYAEHVATKNRFEG